MIPFNPDDYLLVKHNRKLKLALALNEKSRQAVLVDTLDSDEPEHIKLEKEDLIANLGASPAVGKVHGVHIEPMRKQVLKPYGLLCFYKKLEKKEIKTIKKSFSWMLEQLTGIGLEKLMPIGRIEIREKKSKYAGMYVYKRTRDGEVSDKVILFAQDYNDVDYMRYVVAHEMGHALWFRLVSEKLQAEWIERYESRISVENYTQDQLTDLLNNVMEYEGGISAYAREIAEDDTRALIKEVYSHFKRTYRLDRQMVDLMMNNSRRLAKMWPTAVDLGQASGVDLGSYAMVSPKEFFAECFAFHITGKKLPKDCRKLMELTLKKCSYDKQ